MAHHYKLVIFTHYHIKRSINEKSFYDVNANGVIYCL